MPASQLWSMSGSAGWQSTAGDAGEINACFFENLAPLKHPGLATATSFIAAQVIPLILPKGTGRLFTLNSGTNVILQSQQVLLNKINRQFRHHPASRPARTSLPERKS